MKAGAGIRGHLPPKNRRSINATCGSQIDDKDPIARGEFHRKARPTAGSIARGGNTAASTPPGLSLPAPYIRLRRPPPPDAVHASNYRAPAVADDAKTTPR